MNKAVYILLALFLILFLMSCDPIFYLTLNTQNSVTIELECGTIVLTAATMGGVIYSLKQEYSLNKEIIINTKAVNVEFKGESINYNFRDENGLIEENTYILNSEKELMLDFTIQDVVEKGDVIIITAPNFITCEGKSVSLEKLIIEIDKKFK